MFCFKESANKRRLVGLAAGLLLLSACAVQTVKKEPTPPEVKVSVEEGTVLLSSSKDAFPSLSAGKTEIEPLQYKIAQRSSSEKEDTKLSQSRPKAEKGKKGLIKTKVSLPPPPPKVPGKPKPKRPPYRPPWFRKKPLVRVKRDKKPLETAGHTASEKKTDSDEYVVLNFESVDLNFVLQYISEIIGMNYILGTNVSGKITIQTYNKIPKSELFSVLHTILEINGFTTVKQKNYYKLIRLSEAKRYPIETVVENDYRKVPPEDIPVTQVIVLQEMEVSEASKIIKPFMSKGGSIMTHKDLGIMILNDLQSNIRRLMKIISLVDTEVETSGQIAGGQLFVYFLENIDAKDLAGILNQVFISRKKSKNINVPLRLDKSKKPRKKGKKAAAKTSVTKLGSDVELEGEIKIVADDINNALIIKATAKDYKTILSVIKKLDIIPRQALIEVLIVDIKLSENTSMGVEWFLADEKGLTEELKDKNLSLSKGGKTGWSSYSEIIPFGGINYLFQAKTDKLLAFISTMASESKAKVISSPHILAVNNKEASIQISDEQPYSITALSSGVTRDYVTWEYKEAATKLTVTPKINARGLINMQITQEYSEFGPRPSGDAPPSTTRRTANTSAIVKSGQTIVIGGLIKESLTDSRAGIPYLMDIPYLGWLFGFSEKILIRSELVMLITPHALLTEEDARRVTREFSQPLESLEDLDTSDTRLEKLKKYQQIRPKKEKEKETESWWKIPFFSDDDAEAATPEETKE